MADPTHSTFQFVAGMAAGLGGGTLSGLFGVGGGGVLIPLLAGLLGLIQPQAQGVTLAAFLLPNGPPAVLPFRARGAPPGPLGSGGFGEVAADAKPPADPCGYIRNACPEELLVGVDLVVATKRERTRCTEALRRGDESNECPRRDERPEVSNRDPRKAKRREAARNLTDEA